MTSHKGPQTDIKPGCCSSQSTPKHRPSGRARKWFSAQNELYIFNATGMNLKSSRSFSSVHSSASNIATSFSIKCATCKHVLTEFIFIFRVSQQKTEEQCFTAVSGQFQVNLTCCMWSEMCSLTLKRLLHLWPHPTVMSRGQEYTCTSLQQLSRFYHWRSARTRFSRMLVII